MGLHSAALNLADHLRVIGANWWRILLITLAVSGGVFAYSNAQPPVYQAEILLNVAAKDIYTNSQLNEQQLAFRSSFFASVVQNEGTALEAIDLRLGISPPGSDPFRSQEYSLREQYGLTPRRALEKISTSTTKMNGLILIKARASTREEAKDLAEAFAVTLKTNATDEQQAMKTAEALLLEDKIAELTKGIEAELAKPEADRDLSLIDTYTNFVDADRLALIGIQQRPVVEIWFVGPGTASVGGDPVAPKPVPYAIFAGLFGLFLSAELFVLRRALSDHFGRTNDIEAIASFTGLPVLAQIPRGRGPEIVEAFRTLRTNLMFLEGSGRPRTIAFVSPNPGAGKSFAAIHLAEAAAAVDAAVVLVDADLRRPVFHERLSVPREPGLSDALRGMPITEVLHAVEGSPSLLVMPSGSAVSDTVGVFGGKAFRQILDALNNAELVLVDTPAGAVYADALAVSAQCDAALLVLDARTSRRRAVKQMLEGLERTGASVIGVVVNGARANRRDSYERV